MTMKRDAPPGRSTMSPLADTIGASKSTLAEVAEVEGDKTISDVVISEFWFYMFSPAIISFDYCRAF